jgi:hypothetical protein
VALATVLKFGFLISASGEAGDSTSLNLITLGVTESEDTTGGIDWNSSVYLSCFPYFN